MLPVGDLAVRKGMASHFGLTGSKKTLVSAGGGKKVNVYLPTPEEMYNAAEIWKPYRY